MAQALNIFKENTDERQRLTAQQEKESHEKIARAEAIDQMVDSFDRTATGLLEDLSSVAVEMEATSTSMNALAEGMSQQAAATQEISHNVQEASAGTVEVTQNIASVSSAASESGCSAAEVLQVAQQLANQSTDMKREIENFLRDIRAA